VIDAVNTTVSLPIDQSGVRRWASVTFTAAAPGTSVLRFETSTRGLELDFFGLTAAPSVTLTVTPAPEIPLLTPLAASVLAAALAGAAQMLGRRRRSRS
jgi:hypothetical protein